MIRFAVPALALALALPAAADNHKHAAPAAHNATQQEVASNFDRWKAALATKDPKVVTALFTQTAVLSPTVSNDVREKPAEVEAYFVDFLKMSPVPALNERNIQVLDDNTAVEAGVWTFDLVKDGKPTWVTARYTFVWEKQGKEWKIQHLHSSMMPETLKDRPAVLAAK